MLSSILDAGSMGMARCGCGYVSVLGRGGGVQELGSDAYKCEDELHRLCFEIVFTVMMIP